MSATARVVVIHGSYGSPDENWFPWLAERIRKLGHEAIVPALPTPRGQDLQTWSGVFSSQVGEVARNMVLVGHSLGSAFVLSLLEQAPRPVLGTFLVSGFLRRLGIDRFDPINESFICREFDWEGIRSRAGVIHIYHSDNDPYVPLSCGQELASKLGRPLTLIRGGGHMNAVAGYSTFPRLLDDLTVLLARSTMLR